jgi:cobalt/nickel transport system ATP-binding protein
MSTPVIAVAGLRFAYPDGTEALAGIDLHIHAGERVAVLGPNGAGKTTMALHLNGIHRSTTGSIAVSGLAIDDDSLTEIRRRIGLVFQDPDDQLFMPTVRDDVAFGPANLGLRGDDLEARVAGALAAVGMTELADRAPHHLSGGERRRISIATVLAMQPDLLVLDEPTSNLDPAGRRELIGLLGGLDITQLVITHDLHFALETCKRTLIMNEGRIVADGPTREVLADEDLLYANRLEPPYGL